ncbi:hypothetical protein P73_2462 [Celeribacter indicus]|uniref:Helix-turn-helix domain-containing protein n=2 Tax=Celeribacter indicus TaxID=1208324 RepID=A0A0B5E4B2_9RHOB|nr:hypothetical protein P73_2462 [Celeribacter indicus]
MEKHDEFPPLDKWRFDDMTSKTEKLWGLPSIAKALGVSVDKARKLAQKDDVPIYRPDGATYMAFRSDLMAWLRTK